MKRRRSRKNRNTYFKKKNNYKFNFMSNIEGRKNVRNYRDSFKSKLPGNPYNGHLTSNWFWSNYRIAHNFWKMKAPTDDWTGLLRDHPEVEKLIRKYLPNTYYFVSGNWKNNPYENQSNYNRTAGHADSLLRINSELNSTNSHDIEDDDDDDDDDDDNENNGDCEAEEEDASDDIEYEMSEEMIEFFKVSFRHKMSLKKEKEEKEQALDLEAKVIEFQANKLKRASEMKLLYGEEASKIIGMETALQLSFDKYCDTKVPQYWPNIPLNL